MEKCPSREKLELLLNDKLGHDERASVETHVGCCASCGETLTKLNPHGPTIQFQPPPDLDDDFGSERGVPKELEHHPRYHVTGVLGRGGMGIVYKAEHRLLDRPVVLKVIRQDLLSNDAIVARFEREAKLAAKLSHPNIVATYEAEHLGATKLLVMEFIEGVNLAELVSQRGLLPVAESCEIIRQVAVGLQHVHDRNLVHRDIKPANLLVSPSGVVKILDLGLATLKSGAAGGELTADRQFLGTVDYAAPEQWESSRDVDIRADIYSMGCTLYYLLAGQAPFPSSKYSSTMQQMWAHSQAPRPPIRELRSDVPEAVAEIVERMLAKSADDRFSTPGEVAEALRPFVEDCDLAEFVRTARRTTTSRIDLSRVSSIRPSMPQLNTAPPRQSRRALIIGAGALATVALLVVLAFILRGDGKTPSDRLSADGTNDVAPTHPLPPSGTPIRVGVLHSSSGTMAISERSVIDATLLAIDEINQSGGVLGRPVEAVVENGDSNAKTFAAKAEKLITEDKVCTLFGCWTSDSRKTVLQVLEKHDHLLFYPVQYEGLEQSPHIVYTGAAPNQQIIPAIKWCIASLNKKKFFLVGSDYVFPRTASAIIHDQVKELDGEIVGDEYILLGSSDVRDLVDKIVAAEPDVILNMINGDSNVDFFRALRAAGVTPDKTPTISFSISEEELSHSTRDLVGDYAAWNYFQSVDRPQNRQFLTRFQARFGEQRVVSDPMEAAYFGVHLWAQAVQAAGNDNVANIRRAIGNQSFDAPEGLVSIDPETQHTFKVFRIGRVTPQGQFEVVYSSETPIPPDPFPITRSKSEWAAFLFDMQLSWGGQWSKPVK